MRQVLFFIPIKDIADLLPDLGDPVVTALVYFAMGVLAIGLGGFLDRRRTEARSSPSYVFKFFGSLIGVLLIFAGIVVLVAPNNPTVPIYGYGTMLFVAFVGCIALACWLGAREGIAPTDIQDMAIWMFICGIIGARLTFMTLADRTGEFDWTFPTILWQFFRVWDGGLVFYGSAVGGLVGYFAYRFFVRRIRVSHWHMADIVAPCIALGLALGRVGCLLNGCCYGNVAVCEHCPGLGFPMTSPPRYDMTGRGYQTSAGFIIEKDGKTVAAVDPRVPVNLQPRDVLLKINGQNVNEFNEDKTVQNTVGYLLSTEGWPRGKNDIDLRVRHANGTEEDLHWTPLTVPLSPTQIYESISMLFVMLLLLAYYPLRRQPGAVMVLLIFCYGAHRFVNEMLRTDTPPVAFGLTLSQNISILIIGVGIVLALWLRIKTIRRGSSGPPPMPT